jgi:hypothetical protein
MPNTYFDFFEKNGVKRRCVCLLRGSIHVLAQASVFMLEKKRILQHTRIRQPSKQTLSLLQA